ncbi:hypothetical protein [Kordia sp.]|uniref:hypothetical protein n=1 Tax=Kordia sp. TaxID=1965332 RepID=UPI003B5B6E6E
MGTEHKQTFYTRGTYCTKNNELKINTELPEIPFQEESETYEWKLKNCYDISNTKFPCMLIVYGHGHPTDRSRLEAVNMDWDRKTLELNSVFKNTTTLQQKKIFVITLHDEDFKEWHTAVYRFYAAHYVLFDTDTNEYVYDIDILQDFVAGKNIQEQVNEEPKTTKGGVIDPIIMS